MYDTEKRVELVKKRVHEKYRRKERRGICRLSALCTALSAFLVGTVQVWTGVEYEAAVNLIYSGCAPLRSVLNMWT